MEFIHHFIK